MKVVSELFTMVRSKVTTLSQSFEFNNVFVIVLLTKNESVSQINKSQEVMLLEIVSELLIVKLTVCKLSHSLIF